MAVNANSAVPLYYQLQQDLESQISSGSLPPGSRLPSEEDLIEKYGVSRTTVRKAIEELERLEIVEIKRGKGTYVKKFKIIQELTGLTGFVEDMVALGLRPSAKVLETTSVPAPEEAAQQLEIPVGTQVVRIKRVRIADDVPISFDETYLPFEIGNKIVGEDLEVFPIFSLLEEKYETPLSEADYRLAAVSVDSDIALELGIDAGDPILLIERTSYSVDHRPVDYEKLYYRGDKIGFSMRLKRRQPAIHLQDVSRDLR
jgi:GntR family transcriptional regulator